MANPIDFDFIATRLEEAFGHPGDLERDAAALRRTIVASLRDVWNARRAADIERLKVEMLRSMGATAGQFIGNLQNALRTLDRRP